MREGGTVIDLRCVGCGLSDDLVEGRQSCFYCDELRLASGLGLLPPYGPITDHLYVLVPGPWPVENITHCGSCSKPEWMHPVLLDSRWDPNVA